MHAYVIQIPNSMDSVITYFVFYIICIPTAAAHKDNANFLTYTSIQLGFTISYPLNWTLNDRDIVNGHKVTSFTSPDGAGTVFVQIQNATQYEIAVYNMNEAAKTNTIRTHLTPGENLIELDVIY